MPISILERLVSYAAARRRANRKLDGVDKAN